MTAATALRRRTPPETVAFCAIATLALVAFTVQQAAPPLELQIAVIAILAGLLGLPHGALDPLIARRLGLWSTPASFAVFNGVYLGAVVAVVALWLVAPIPSLVVFLVISAVHFGADWNQGRPMWLRAIAGIGLLSLPSLGNRDEVARLYEILAPGGGEAIAIAQSLIAPLAMLGMLAGAAIALRTAPHHSVELVLAAALALVAPPLVFFVIYFCALHSFRHLREGFRAEVRERTTILITVTYTVVPILAVVAFLLLAGPAPALDARLVQVVFIGLAGLTVPHMVLVALEARAAASRTGAPLSARH